MLNGRLTINIISSELPGETLASAPRYGRTVEVMTILRALLSGEAIDMRGEHYRMMLDPPRVRTQSGRCPPFYFGGLSEDAREAAAAAADVYLMWPDTMDGVRSVRSSDDHCVVLLLGPRLTQRIHLPATRAKFTAATQAQLKLGREVSAQVAGSLPASNEGAHMRGIVMEVWGQSGIWVAVD